jgi:hypothetical protein
MLQKCFELIVRAKLILPHEMRGNGTDSYQWAQPLRRSSGHPSNDMGDR